MRRALSSGRTAVLLASLAQTLRAGETVALVDVAGTLDLQAAHHDRQDDRWYLDGYYD